MGESGKQGSLIQQKICDIIADFKPIKKEQINKHQKWKFRGIDDVYNVLQPLLAKHGVSIRPIDCEIFVHEQVKSAHGNAGYHNITFYTFRLEAIDGSYLDSKAIGECIDYGDKAIGKSASYAMKNMVFQTFCVATDDLPDPDKESHPDIQYQKQQTLIFDSTNPVHCEKLGGVLGKLDISPELHVPIANALNGKEWTKANINTVIGGYRK